ncbi:MAG: DUF3883 domain-containing protein [Deltaproteobacteria bacterium]|nr:DUF3883 domain-containing protein [Deltaproteobacteria bacterium]
MKKLTTREKLILTGLFLSKFDERGLKVLGFGGFSEAFNTLAFSLKASPASLKNYRDEFDPFFPNPRKGWHKRPIRQYCKTLMDEFGDMSIDEFAALIKTEISVSGELALVEERVDTSESSTFAKRLVTGQAAEKYFEKVYSTITPFQECELVNTTSLGCGFDYRMLTRKGPFLAVEVKGMTAANGGIQLTSKEHKAAELFEDRFFLFVVRNFAEKPFHTMFQNPLRSQLEFERRETVTVQVSWSTSIGR